MTEEKNQYDTPLPNKSDKEFEDGTQDDLEYPPKKVVLPTMAALYLSMFLVALDRTIIGTAIPSISNEFKSFGDIAWYETGFLLPLCALQLTFGRIYKFYSAKWVLIILVAIFEIGSIVCAAAPSSPALIVGRVITGIGATGIASGALITINTIIPLKSRPKYSGSIGAVFGLASVLGPLLGGYLTSITWRWCFWINLPIGGVALLALIIFTPKTPAPSQSSGRWIGRLKELDPVGFILIAPSIICALFALQWGGTKYPWSDGRIIALFVVFGVLLIAFVGVQIYLGDNATVPPRLLRQRTILAACFASIGIGSLIVVFAFYLPIWFQAIQGKSPQSSGLSLLGFLLSNVVLVIAGGILVSLIGYYTPFLIVGGAILIVGSALISTWRVETDSSHWIGYQIIAGAGLGLTLQQPNIAAQTILPKDTVALGLSLLGFMQFFGGNIFITVCQNLLANKLVAGLEGKVQGLNAGDIANQGVTALRDLVPADKLPFVLEVYNDALRSIWYVALGLSVLVTLSALGFEWKNVKTMQERMTAKPGKESPEEP